MLTELVGPVRRSEILRSLFERTIASLLPAVEIALAGYDAIVGSGPINTPDAAVRRRHYTTTSIWVLLALVHLVGVAMSVPIPDDTLFNNFKAMVLLAMRVAQAARLGEERLYDDPKLVERGRRAFWGFAIFDNMHATMHNVDPVIQPEDLLLSGVKASNVSDGEILQGLGKISAMGGVLGAIATKAYKILCDSWRTPVPGGHQPPALSPDRIAAGSTGIQVPLATPEPIPLISSPVPEGPVTYRITRLAALVTQQHRRLRRPYLFKEEWTRMVAEVDECFSALPPQLRSGDTIPVFLDAARHVLGTEVGTMIGSVTYMKLMYHGIVVTLASPPDEQLYLGNVEPEWVGSEAFLLVGCSSVVSKWQSDSGFLEYCRRKNMRYKLPRSCSHWLKPRPPFPKWAFRWVESLLADLLIPLTDSECFDSQFFQYCVVRTGLIHHVYLRSAFSVSSAPSDEIVRTAKEQFLIHAKALRKGQKALGMGESRSWWYERWLAVTGIEG